MVSPSRQRVAFDVTPLTMFRTGIGLSVQETWKALGDLAGGPVLIPYVLGLRSRTRSAGLPAGIRAVRIPTRALLAMWARAGVPRLDWQFGDAGVVHATNFVVAPSRHPTVVTVHDVGFAIDPSTANPVVATFPAVLRKALDRGAEVHVTTEVVASEVEEHFGPGLRASGRITVVPWGLPARASPLPLPEALAGRIGHGPYVLAVGTHERRKNLPRLVEAFGRAAPPRTDVRLVIAGQHGPDTARVLGAVEALGPPFAGRVVVAGPVPAGVLTTLREGALALAYPSLYEGFGFPPLEAMSAGIPVLAGSGGAVAEVAGPAAELAEPRDVGSLARGLARVVFDEARRAELVDNGRRHAAGFSWQRTARGLADLYSRLATSS
ncbi:MAG: glycosyltransferase family 4 protein [Acidimicrobiales bacterium]